MWLHVYSSLFVSKKSAGPELTDLNYLSALDLRQIGISCSRLTGQRCTFSTGICGHLCHSDSAVCSKTLSANICIDPVSSDLSGQTVRSAEFLWSLWSSSVSEVFSQPQSGCSVWSGSFPWLCTAAQPTNNNCCTVCLWNTLFTSARSLYKLSHSSVAQRLQATTFKDQTEPVQTAESW